MPSIKIDYNYFAPLFTPAFLYQKLGDDFNPKDDERTNLLVSLEDLDSIDATYEDQTYSVAENVQGFLQSLFGNDFDKLPLAQSVLGVTYIGDTPKVIKSPVVTKRDGVVGLFIGDDKVDKENSHAFFPLLINEGKISFEGTNINQLGIDAFEIKTGDRQYRVPQVVIPHSERKTNKIVFQIAVQVTSDCDYDNFKMAWESLTSLDVDEAKEAWNDIVDSVSSGISANAKLQQIFEKQMKDGTFPKKGVLLPITSLIKKGKIEKKDGTARFYQATFGLDTNSLPSVPVCAYMGGDADDIPLNTVGSISCGERDNLGKLSQMSIISTQPPTGLRPWYLYISAPNAKGNKIPEHSVFTGTLPKKYQELLEEQKSMEYWVF